MGLVSVGSQSSFPLGTSKLPPTMLLILTVCHIPFMVVDITDHLILSTLDT